MAAPAETGVNPGILLARAQSGDAQAFSSLVGLYEEKAIHTACALLGNMEDARDAAQEAFVKAYQGLKSFKGSSQFSTWLTRIVINQCKDMMRKKKNMKFFTFFSREEDEKDEMDPMDRLASPQPDSRKAAMDREIEEQVRKSLEKLPVQQKTIFALRYLEGMSLEEIAEAMSLTTGAIKAHLWQAGQKMKKHLAHLAPQGGAS